MGNIDQHVLSLIKNFQKYFKYQKRASDGNLSKMLERTIWFID